MDKLTSLKWTIVIAVIMIDAIWIGLSDFNFMTSSAVQVVAIVALLSLVGWFYRVKRPMQNFEVMCSETALLIAFTSAGAVFSYLVTSWNLPLIDHHLVRIDGWLGFDWLGYVGFINAHPALSAGSSIVYATTISQIALCIIALSFCNHVLRAQQLGSAVIIGGLLCILIAGLIPSSGALAYFKPSADFVAAGSPFVDLHYKQEFFDLRSGVQRHISLDAMRGLVAFPSFHATLSILAAIALWPFKSWRLPVCLLNFCVLLATPADGGHHLIDALGGTALALLSWKVAAWMMKRFPASSTNSVQSAPTGSHAVA